MTHKRPLQPTNDNIGHISIATLKCRCCSDPIEAREGSIYGVIGTEVRAWCSPLCASRDGVSPWAQAAGDCRATWGNK